MECGSVEDYCLEKNINYCSPVAFRLVPVYCSLRIQRVQLIKDDAMDGRLLPSCLRKHMAASIHHVVLSLLHGEKAKVS